MTLYPLKLSPVCKEAIWGGNTLKEKYNKIADIENLAESWELTVRADGMSVIENGAFSGVPLEQYIIEHGNDVIAKGFDGDRFPLLLKLIDAAAPLSVQVHPDDAYSLSNEGELGKTEMWYVLKAKEGAKLVYGLKEGHDSATMAQAIENGRVEDELNYVDVHEGDVFFIPSGLVHAIGEGIVIAELQQNSNITYRVYDYGRIGKDGRPRELHVKKSLDVIKPYSEEQISRIRFECGYDNETLAACKYFCAKKIDVGCEREIEVRDGFVSLLCLDGECGIIHNGISYEMKKGDSYFLPAGLGKCVIRGSATLFVSSLPENS